MPCCEKEDKSDCCDTCGWSIDGEFTCYSPNIRKNPQEDSEWISRKGRAIDEDGRISFDT